MKFIISEQEKNEIRGLYGLLNEEISISLPITVRDSYTAKNCDELHAFQSTGGKVIGNMNVTVGDKLKKIYDDGINPKVTNVMVDVKDMTVNWTVTIDKSDDGYAWVGFTSRGAGCNNDVINRAVSTSAGNDKQSAKSKIETTYNEQDIDIEIVNDFVYTDPANKNSFRQVFYRYTKPINNPPKKSTQIDSQQNQTTQKTYKFEDNTFEGLRKQLKSQNFPILIDEQSIKLSVSYSKTNKTLKIEVTFNPGKTVIKGMSIIPDNSGSEEVFKDRLDKMKDDNKKDGLTMYTPKNLKGNLEGIHYQLVYFT